MILTTEKQTPVSEIKSKLDTNLPLEKYGDIGDFYEPNISGSLYFNLNVVNPELFTLLLANLDNDSFQELMLFEGKNTLFLDIKEDLVLILVGNSANKLIGSVEIESINQSQNPQHKLTVSGIGDYNANIPNNSYYLSTNKGLSTSTVSTFLFGDSKVLTNLSADNKQATGLALSNLEIGKYSADINVSKSDLNNDDKLLLFDGLSEPLTIINSKSAETQKTITFDIPYGFIKLVAVDTMTTSGVTEFIFSNLKKIGELNYFPPQQLPLTFSKFLGAVKSSKTEAIITTGTGSRSISTLKKEIEIPEEILAEDYVEGGYGTYDLINGRYRLTYELKTADKENIDTVFATKEGKLKPLISSDSAQIKYSSSQNTTGIKTFEVDVIDGELTTLVLDRITTTGTTEIKFTKLEYLGLSSSEPIEYLIDTTVEKNLANISFNLGGDVTKKSFNLRLEENSQVNIALNSDLIIEFLKNNQSVYSTEYANKLILDLENGDYEFNLFTESSTSQNYQLDISVIGGFNIYEPIESFPPNPQPETFRKLGTTKDNCFDFGILKPYEIDDNSGKTWNKGYLYPSAHLGFANVINSIAKGEIQVFSFEIDTVSYLNMMFGDKQIKVKVESMNQIIGEADYGMHLELATGEYFVFVEGLLSEPTEYELSMYFSSENPDYAD